MSSRTRSIFRADEEPAPFLGRIASWPVAITVLLFTVASLAFLTSASEFLRGIHDLDRSLLFGLPGPHDPAGPVGSKRLVDIAWSLTALGSPEVLAVLTAGVIGYLAISRRTSAALLVLFSVGGGALVAFGLKGIFEYLKPHHGVTLDGNTADTSFPSGHAMLAALVYLTLAAVWTRTEPRLWVKVYAVGFAAVVAGLVGVSRVYLGLHWPSDILAGWMVGLGWAALCWIGMRVCH